ncbi:hypothetical protein [Catellatospora tritici]|uniref:hypothetical protein n=1 Tax=Catellatospora tritici TaxID=2851566 RepID=UPI001C2DA941|nr:hypothetical protein [Catellatospora tritici]MBV1855522.1 hypothetical protein [Catellatospora tritici]
MIQAKKLMRPLPQGLPPQPIWPYRDVEWNSYDVPRMWDMVHGEDDPLGWEQIQGFRQLSELIDSHVAALERQREQLWNAWPPESTPAAGVLLRAVEKHINALKSDSLAAGTTSHGLSGIMTSLAGAKKQMRPLAEEWFSHTSYRTRPGPWWNHIAERLNNEARAIMAQSDADVNAYRSRIILPVAVIPPAYSKTEAIKDGSTDDEQTRSGVGGRFTPNRPVPPVPGYPPIVGSGPDLEGLPTEIPLRPGQPISMLPIMPGNPYVPGGGAYILPGPGVGAGGYIVPMPTQAGSATGYGAAALGARNASGNSMMPMPIPGGAGAGARGAGGNGHYRRQADTIWPVRQGVPPIIAPDAASPSEAIDRETTEAFQQWYTELAMPWRLDGEDGPAPTVTIRRGVDVN